jgi:hypothetical protein
MTNYDVTLSEDAVDEIIVNRLKEDIETMNQFLPPDGKHRAENEKFINACKLVLEYYGYAYEKITEIETIVSANFEYITFFDDTTKYIRYNSGCWSFLINDGKTIELILDEEDKMFLESGYQSWKNKE